NNFIQKEKQYNELTKSLQGNNDKLSNKKEEDKNDDIEELEYKLYTVDFPSFLSSTKSVCTFTGHTDLDIDNNKKVQSFYRHSSEVSCVKFSPYHYHSNRQKVICSSLFDNSIRFWDFKENKELMVLKEHKECVSSIAFLPFKNGQYLCSGSHDSTVRLWDVETLRTLSVFNANNGGVTCIDVSPSQSSNSKDNYIGIFGGNGYRICSGSFDNTIYTYDIETRKLLGTLKGHTKRVLSVQYGSNELGNIGCAYNIIWII
ncbi:G-protein beta WD-40 repeats containing protein, partial [Reticulomyxa filosa]